MAQSGITADSPAVALRNLMEQCDEALDCPGVYDALTARIALHNSFAVLYVGALSACGSCMTQPDTDSGAQTEFHNHVEMIAELALRFNAVVIADDETGVGDAVMVDRMVKRHIKGTVAGIVISDRTPGVGKDPRGYDPAMSEQQFLERVTAASNARKMHGDIVIIARSSALSTLGPQVAINRLKKARELGADVLGLTGVGSRMSPNDFARHVQPSPIVISSKECVLEWREKLAVDVQPQMRLVFWPDIAIGSMAHYVGKAVKHLAKHGIEPSWSKISSNDIHRLMGFGEMEDIRSEAHEAAKEEINKTPRASSSRASMSIASSSTPPSPRPPSSPNYSDNPPYYD